MGRLQPNLNKYGRCSQIRNSASGILVDAMGGNWALFFVLTALMVIPSLVILYRLRHNITAIEKGNSAR